MAKYAQSGLVSEDLEYKLKNHCKVDYHIKISMLKAMFAER